MDSRARGSCGSRTGGHLRGRRKNFRKSFARKWGRKGLHSWKNNYANEDGYGNQAFVESRGKGHAGHNINRRKSKHRAYGRRGVRGVSK